VSYYQAATAVGGRIRRSSRKTGVTIDTYERAGDIRPGSFEFDEPTEAELEQRRRLAAA
jgi:hypothetical protein